MITAVAEKRPDSTSSLTIIFLPSLLLAFKADASYLAILRASDFGFGAKHTCNFHFELTSWSTDGAFSK